MSISEFDKRLEKEIPSAPSAEDKLKNVVKVTEKVTKKTANVIWFWLPNVMMTLLSLVIIGIYELATANFDPKIFSTAEFWNSYLSFQMAVWISIFNILMVAYRIYKKRNDRYVDLKAKKDRLVTIDNHVSFIGDKANTTDRNRKIRAWKIHNNFKLNQLLLKYEIYDLKYFLYTEDNTEKTYQGKMKRWKRKIDKLLIVLTDEWISKNIDGVKRSIWWFGFQYATVTREKLVSGGKVIQNNHGEQDFEKHTATTFIDLFVSGFLFTSILMFLLLSFRLDPKQTTVETVIKILIKVLLLGYNVMMTWLKSDEAFERTELKVLDETTNEITKYYNSTFTPEERVKLENDYIPK